MIKGKKKQCNIVDDAKICIHKTLKTCDIKEPSQLSQMFFNFILNIFDCKYGYSFWQCFAIFGTVLIILLSAVAGVVCFIFKRR